MTDDAGNRVAVMVDLEPYEALTEAVEELGRYSCLRRGQSGEAIPFEQAIHEIEQARP